MLATVVHSEPAQRRTGLELLIDSTSDAYYARPHRLRGVAYEVLGLAQLSPLPGARVRARCGGDWAEVTAGDRGAFELEVQVPTSPLFRVEADAYLEFQVIHGQDRRSIEIPINLRSPFAVEARADRQTYEPGETVHIWTRVYDVQTLRPLAGVSVRIVTDHYSTLEATTSAAGVATIDRPLANQGGVAHINWDVYAGPSGLETSNSVSFIVGERPTTDLLVTVETSPETASPGEEVAVTVEVRSPSGFPVREAQVQLTGSHQNVNASTGVDGRATLQLRAPQYSSTEGGQVSLAGTARHPGYGVAGVGGSFRVRPPRSLQIEAIVIDGGLVPEVRGRLILSVFQSDGISPATGATVEVRGAAIDGGRSTTTVGRHGFLTIPVRPMPGSFARHVGESRCAESSATTIDVMVRGEVEQRTQLCVPVLEHALVAPTIRRPAVAPGETIEVSLARRPAVARRPVVVDLLAQTSSGAIDLVSSVTVPGTTALVRFTAPDDRIGIFYVDARPVMAAADEAASLFHEDHEDVATAEGYGSYAPLLVRPAAPTFPRLELDQEVYQIRGEAHLTVHTPTGAPTSYVAILARDMAQHEGEQPFAEYFLRRAFDRAILDPSTPDADVLVRAALASSAELAMRGRTYSPQWAGPAFQRDPVRLASDFVTRRVGGWMVAIETALEDALQAGTVESISTGDGRRRRFLPELLERALDDEEVLTLGDGPATTDMLTALDPSFTFETVSRRVARRRLVMLMGILASYIDPEGNSEHRPRGRSTEPPERWLSELVRLGVIAPTDLHDPWGGTFVLRRTGRQPAFTIAVEAEGYELISPGPDGRLNTPDDVRNPFERVVDEGTLYARASGEDELIAQLSALSPGAEVLQDLIEAYARLNDEALEELIGDRLGAGGAVGFGYGAGAGSLRGRRASSPSIRTGRAAVRGHLGLGGVARHDFPATLFFEPEAAIDASGRTVIDIPLAEAPTTYLVEAILWRDDGWVWSGSVQLRVDMELMVDAPVPSVVTVGDDLRLPLRVANRTKTDRTVWLHVEGSDALELRPIQTGPVKVPARDAIDVPVVVSLRRAAKGQLTIAARTKAGAQLDAVTRPMIVRQDKRRALHGSEDIFRGRGTISTTVPEGATPLVKNRISVIVGPTIFRRGETGRWLQWLDTLAGTWNRGSTTLERWELEDLVEDDNPINLAHLVSASWLMSSVRDAPIMRAVSVLEDYVEGAEPEHASDVRYLSRLLLLLAPAVRNAETRSGLRPRVLQLARELRVKIENGGALFADAPWLSARAAAALLWTASRNDPDNRALELLERARDALVTVDEDLWLEGGSDDNVGSSDELFVASSLLALCEIEQGREEIAFRLVRSLARLLRSSNGNLPEVRNLTSEDRMIAAAAAATLGNRHHAEAVVVRVDGTPHTIELTGGSGSLGLQRLGEAGEHLLELADAERDVVVLAFSSEYTVDWDVPPPLSGPFSVTIDGTAGYLDDRSGLVLTVRNRIPRLVSAPVVEIGLPAGVEIDEEARRQINRGTSTDLNVSSDMLTLRLRPIGPRQEVEIELPWSWTSAGQLTGLGIMAYSDDRPEAISVTPSRRVEVTNINDSQGETP